jgi:hypothetical protein
MIVFEVLTAEEPIQNLKAIEANMRRGSGTTEKVRDVST